MNFLRTVPEQKTNSPKTMRHTWRSILQAICGSGKARLSLRLKIHGFQRRRRAGKQPRLWWVLSKVSFRQACRVAKERSWGCAYYASAKAKNDKDSFQEYMKKYPQGRHFTEGRGASQKGLAKMQLKMIFVKARRVSIWGTLLWTERAGRRRTGPWSMFERLLHRKVRGNGGRVPKIYGWNRICDWSPDKSDGCTIVSEKKWKKETGKTRKTPGFAPGW